MSRLSSFSPSRAFITAPARELGVADHPVFQALPLEARQRIDATGRLQRTQSFGRALAEHELHFVLNGAVGLFPGAGDICVSLVPAGAVQGWDRALWPTSPVQWPSPWWKPCCSAPPRPRSSTRSVGIG